MSARACALECTWRRSQEALLRRKLEEAGVVLPTPQEAAAANAARIKAAARKDVRDPPSPLVHSHRTEVLAAVGGVRRHTYLEPASKLDAPVWRRLTPQCDGLTASLISRPRGRTGSGPLGAALEVCHERNVAQLRVMRSDVPEPTAGR